MGAHGFYFQTMFTCMNDFSFSAFRVQMDGKVLLALVLMKAIEEWFFSKSQYGLLFPFSLPNLANGPLRAKSSGAVMQSADLKIMLLARFYSLFKQILCEQLKLEGQFPTALSCDLWSNV